MAEELLKVVIDEDGNIVLPLSGNALERAAATSIIIEFLANAVEARILGESGEILVRKLLPNPQAEMPEDSHLVLAAQSSCEFWDNPVDDEAWNNA